MAAVAREEPNYIWSEKRQADWRTACDLLKQAQYELVAEFLGQKQKESEQTGNVLLADTLAAIRQICLACRQYQVGAEWFSQAYQEASGREDELRHLLGAILELVDERSTLEAQARLATSTGIPSIELSLATPRIPESATLRSLWQRLYSVLGWKPDLRPVEADAFKADVQALAASPVEKGELDPPGLIVYCLGPFQVYQDDQLIENWPSSKGKSVLKYLVTHHEHPIGKEVLMDLFWPDAQPDSARNNLNVAIYSLRQALHQARTDFSHVLFQDDCYLLNPELRIWVDVEVFMQHCSAAQRLEQQKQSALAMHEYQAAEVLYQGEFLEEDRYEDWLLPQRQHLQETYLNLLDRLSRYYLNQGAHSACVAVCGKMLAVDPGWEEAHRRLMRCYSRQGQRHLALRQYHLCLETLKAELDVSPTSATMALYEQIRQGWQV